MNPKSIVKIVSIGFLVVGMILTIVGIPLSISHIDVSNKIETTAVITEIRSYRMNGDRHWETFVQYEAYGQQYERELGFYTSSYYEGQEIAIYFDEKDPRSIMAANSRYTILILPAIGLILTGVGLGFFLIPMWNRKRRASLRETGTLIHAAYGGTDLNRHYSVNGQHPYQILCRWRDPENGEERVFRSQNLWQDPSLVIEGRGIATFPVYLHPKKKNKYVVDINTVLELMGEQEI